MVFNFPSKNDNEMAFNKAALNHFFQDQEELGLAAAMQAQLVEEGISSIMDLQFINNNSIKELVNNLCHLSGSRQTPFHFSITSQTKMLDTSNYV